MFRAVSSDRDQFFASAPALTTNVISDQANDKRILGKTFTLGFLPVASCFLDKKNQVFFLSFFRL